MKKIFFLTLLSLAVHAHLAPEVYESVSTLKKVFNKTKIQENLLFHKEITPKSQTRHLFYHGETTIEFSECSLKIVNKSYNNIWGVSTAFEELKSYVLELIYIIKYLDISEIKFNSTVTDASAYNLGTDFFEINIHSIGAMKNFTLKINREDFEYDQSRRKRFNDYSVNVASLKLSSLNSNPSIIASQFEKSLLNLKQIAEEDPSCQ